MKKLAFIFLAVSALTNLANADQSIEEKGAWHIPSGSKIVFDNDTSVVIRGGRNDVSIGRIRDSSGSIRAQCDLIAKKNDKKDRRVRKGMEMKILRIGTTEEAGNHYYNFALDTDAMISCSSLKEEVITTAMFRRILSNRDIRLVLR